MQYSKHNALEPGKHSGEESNNGDTDICISIPKGRVGHPRDKSVQLKDIRVSKEEICEEADFFRGLERRFEMRLNKSLEIEIASV